MLGLSLSFAKCAGPGFQNSVNDVGCKPAFAVTSNIESIKFTIKITAVFMNVFVLLNKKTMMLLGVMLSCLAYTLLVSSKVDAAESEKVSYVVSFTDPAHHLLQVDAVFPAGNEELIIQIPVWRSGHYKILELGNGISHFKASDKTGEALRVEKQSKSSWLVSNPERSAIRVSYELYANELGSRTRSLTSDHFYFDASAVFVYADPYRAAPLEVSSNLPAGWQAVSGITST